LALEEELSLLAAAGEAPAEPEAPGPAGEAPAEPELLSLMRQKEKDLMLAARLGKALLERNQDMTRQYEKMHKELTDKLEGADRTSLQCRDASVCCPLAVPRSGLLVPVQEQIRKSRMQKRGAAKNMPRDLPLDGQGAAELAFKEARVRKVSKGRTDLMQSTLLRSFLLLCLSCCRVELGVLLIASLPICSLPYHNRRCLKNSTVCLCPPAPGMKDGSPNVFFLFCGFVLQHLEQEKHELRRRFENKEGEWEGRVSELESDVKQLQGELEKQQVHLREADREKTRAVQELSEQNQRLLDQLSRRLGAGLACGPDAMGGVTGKRLVAGVWEGHI
ncbi:BICD family-like cargo adapter 1, partial [Varanus komodoensis]